MKRPTMFAAAAALIALASSPALALQIYVSNEKDNTVTVIDGNTLQPLGTIKTARRPRGIIASPDGKEVYVAAGDGDIMDVIDTSKLAVTHQLELRSRPGTDGRRSQGRDALHRQRGRLDGDRHGYQDGRRDRGNPGRGRARGHGRQSRLQIHRRHLGKHEHGACDRQCEPESRRQRAGRHASARGEVHAGWQGSMGVLRGRRHRLGDRHRKLEGEEEDRLRGGRRAPRAAAAGRHRVHQGREICLRRARSRATAWP